MIEGLKAGDSIRQSWIRRLVDQVNRNSRAIQDLQTSIEGDYGDIQAMASPVGGGGGGSMPTSITFSESTRGYATQQITDSNGDTHTIQIATSITMTASNAGTSYEWTFSYASG